MAEACFRHLLAHVPEAGGVVVVDSAGTDAYHAGEPPDPRTLATLRAHGWAAGYAHAARRVGARDLGDFDYLLAMDRHNLRTLRRKRNGWAAAAKGADAATIGLFGDVEETAEDRGEELVDPYYGEDDGFEIVFEQCVRFSRAWIKRLLGWELEIDGKGAITATKMASKPDE